MTRIANFVGAILFAAICLAAAVFAGAAGTGAEEARADSPTACCVYMIF